MNKNLPQNISEYRFERKWAFGSDLDINTFLISIYRSTFNFTEAYKARNVNTIYFDDTEYSSIYENLDGVTFKKKYRLRWYGNSEFIEKPQFEIKSKNGLISKKKVIPMLLSERIKLDENGLQRVTSIIQNNYKIKKIVFPILSTHYYRHYFISSNKHVRATLDTNLKSHQLYGYQDLNFKKNFKNSVFEIKYGKNFDNYVKKNLSNISLRISKSSKYVISSLDQPISFS
jgi:hypothetical protein